MHDATTGRQSATRAVAERVMGFTVLVPAQLIGSIGCSLEWLEQGPRWALNHRRICNLAGGAWRWSSPDYAIDTGEQLLGGERLRQEGVTPRFHAAAQQILAQVTRAD